MFTCGNMWLHIKPTGYKGPEVIVCTKIILGSGGVLHYPPSFVLAASTFYSLILLCTTPNSDYKYYKHLPLVFFYTVNNYYPRTAGENCIYYGGSNMKKFCV